MLIFVHYVILSVEKAFIKIYESERVKMLKILMIDDDTINNRIAESTLRNHNYEIVSVTSCEEGLRRLSEGGMDLLLLDIDMLHEAGDSLIEEIRRQPGNENMRVVFLTISGYSPDQKEMERLGVVDYIGKPYFEEELVNIVRRVLYVEHENRILVVDDEMMNLMLAKKLLSTHYQVQCVSSGGEALTVLEQSVPNLILLDLHMPDMNGLSVLKRMQESDNQDIRNIPVIFLTADGDKETEAEIFKAGAMDYIQKPLVAQVAVERINRILELRYLQNSLQTEVEQKTKELEESSRKIKNLSMQIMYALTGAVDAKDQYTNGHSNRVARYSREIARRMGKSKKEIDNIFCAALLHDVGKIGVPDEIINKPSKLTDEEYEIMKSHPVIGANILRRISELPELSVGARWHHERYDGKGYPDGLKGEEIKEIARIIGVADAYDAMSSNRSYRDALPQDYIRREIEKGKGTQFDPEIADIMLQLIDEDTDYHMREH